MIPHVYLRKIFLLCAVSLAVLWGGCRTWSAQEEQAARFYNEGNLYREAGRLDEAVEAYRSALEAKPDLTAATYNLALTLTFLDCEDDALSLLQGLRQRDPKNLTVLRALAWVAMEKGEINDALGYYAAVLDLFPADAEALKGAADIHDAEGRAAQAVVLRRTLVRLDDNVENMMALVLSLADAGEFDESLSLCEDILAEDSLNRDALRMASVAAEALGLPREAAIYESRNIAACTDDDPAAWWHLARINLVELEEYEEGIEALKKALELGYSDEAAFESLLNDAPGVIHAGIQDVITSRQYP